MDPQHNQSTPVQPPHSRLNFSSLKTIRWFDRYKGFFSLAFFVVGVLIAAFVIQHTIFQSYYVDGTSMTPTLRNNDWLVIEKVSRTGALATGHSYIPQRGQIVVLDSSLVAANGSHEQLVKRVIGLPGDTVSIGYDGVVKITNAENPNGFDVDSQLGLELQPTYVSSPMQVTVPQGQVFVMGDNRGENGSYDSRAFGPIDTSKLQGRLWARVLPVDQAKVFK